jgi:hypothetical protein
MLDVAGLKDLVAKVYGPPRLARLKMMIEVALHQSIRPLASGLIFASQAVMRSARRVPEY